MEHSEDIPPAVDQRNVRPRFDGPSQGAPSNERTDYAVPAIHLRDPSLGGQHREGSPISLLPLTLHSQLPRNAGPDPDSTTPLRAIVPPRTDREPTPILMDVNPESGSIIGNARIWLQGKDFPAHLPLFARFGTAVVPTVSPVEIPFEPYLIKFLRRSPPAPFFPVICLPQPCQVLSMLHSQKTTSKTHRSMGPVSQSFGT